MRVYNFSNITDLFLCKTVLVIAHVKNLGWVQRFDFS